MLLQALVACAGVTLMSVATNRGIRVSGRVRAEGDVDFRGTMGVDCEASRGRARHRRVWTVAAQLSAVQERLIAYGQTNQTWSR